MSKNTIDVYSIGTKVKLADDVFGTVIGIMVRDHNHVTYECGWWNGRSFDSRWFYSSEIEVTVSEKNRIGFI
jgi:hypothetical protein